MNVIELLSGIDALHKLQYEFSVHSNLSDFTQDDTDNSVSAQSQRLQARRRGDAGLSLTQFVYVMLKVLPSNITGINLNEKQNEHTKLSDETILKTIEKADRDIVITLIDLFREIDMNGDECLQWDEFTSFCIETGKFETRNISRPLLQRLQYIRELEDRSNGGMALSRHILSPRSKWKQIKILYSVEQLNETWLVEERSSQIDCFDSSTFSYKGSLDIHNRTQVNEEISSVSTSPNSKQNTESEKDNKKQSPSSEDQKSAATKHANAANLAVCITAVHYSVTVRMVCIAQSDNRISIWRLPAANSQTSDASMGITANIGTLGDLSLLCEANFVDYIHLRGSIASMVSVGDLLFVSTSATSSVWGFDILTGSLLQRIDLHTEGVTDLICVQPTIQSGTPYPRPYCMLISSSLDTSICACKIFHKSVPWIIRDERRNSLVNQPGQTSTSNLRRNRVEKNMYKNSAGMPMDRPTELDILTEELRMWGHQRAVRRILWESQSLTLFTCGFDTEILAWDLDSKKPLLRISGHAAPLISMQLLPSHFLRFAPSKTGRHETKSTVSNMKQEIAPSKRRNSMSSQSSTMQKQLRLPEGSNFANKTQAAVEASTILTEKRGYLTIGRRARPLTDEDAAVKSSNIPYLVTMDSIGFLKVWSINISNGVNINCILTSDVRSHAIASKGKTDSNNSPKKGPGSLASIVLQTSLPKDILKSSSVFSTQDTNSSSNELSAAFSPQLMTIASRPGHIFIGAEQVHILKPVPVVINQGHLSQILWNPITQIFLYVFGSNIEFYDYMGSELGISCSIPESDITCTCFDGTYKKLVVGTANGSIYTVNCRNGMKLKEQVNTIRARQKINSDSSYEIFSVAYVEYCKSIIAVTTDRTILSLDDSDPNTFEVTRQIGNIHDWPITCCAMSPTQTFFATASLDGSLKIWRADSLRLHQHLSSTKSEPSSVAFLTDNVLVVTDVEGILHFCTFDIRHEQTNSMYNYSLANIDQDRRALVRTLTREQAIALAADRIHCESHQGHLDAYDIHSARETARSTTSTPGSSRETVPNALTPADFEARCLQVFDSVPATHWDPINQFVHFNASNQISPDFAGLDFVQCETGMNPSKIRDTRSSTVGGIVQNIPLTTSVCGNIELYDGKAERILVTGDAIGRIKIWDSNTIMDQAQIQESCVSKNTTLNMKSIENTHRSLNTIQSNFPLLAQWYTTCESIHAIDIIDSPPSILIMGTDKSAQLFSVTGEFLGSLAQGKLSTDKERQKIEKSTWFFCPNQFKTNIRKNIEAKEILSNVAKLHAKYGEHDLARPAPSEAGPVPEYIDDDTEKTHKIVSIIRLQLARTHEQLIQQTQKFKQNDEPSVKSPYATDIQHSKLDIYDLADDETIINACYDEIEQFVLTGNFKEAFKLIQKYPQVIKIFSEDSLTLAQDMRGRQAIKYAFEYGCRTNILVDSTGKQYDNENSRQLLEQLEELHTLCGRVQNMDEIPNCSSALSQLEKTNPPSEEQVLNPPQSQNEISENINDVAETPRNYESEMEKPSSKTLDAAFEKLLHKYPNFSAQRKSYSGLRPKHDPLEINPSEFLKSRLPSITQRPTRTNITTSVKISQPERIARLRLQSSKQKRSMSMSSLSIAHDILPQQTPQTDQKTNHTLTEKQGLKSLNSPSSISHIAETYGASLMYNGSLARNASRKNVLKPTKKSNDTSARILEKNRRLSTQNTLRKATVSRNQQKEMKSGGAGAPAVSVLDHRLQRSPVRSNALSKSKSQITLPSISCLSLTKTDSIEVSGTLRTAIQGKKARHRFGSAPASDVLLLKSLFDLHDANGDGRVDLKEFVQSKAWKQSSLGEVASSIFSSIDRSCTGYITLEELLSVVFPHMRQSEITRMANFARGKEAYE